MPFSTFSPFSPFLLKTFCVALQRRGGRQHAVLQLPACGAGEAPGAHCTIASSPAAQTSTIFTPALHFLITSPNTPAQATQAVTAMWKPHHAAPSCFPARARTVGDISGGFVFGDHVRLRTTPQSA
jgi:hypothetical protein